MNNILKIALTLAVGIVLAGCYNDFDNPAPAKVYTDKDFTETGAEIISIKDLKATSSSRARSSRPTPRATSTSRSTSTTANRPSSCAS